MSPEDIDRIYREATRLIQERQLAAAVSLNPPAPEHPDSSGNLGERVELYRNSGNYYEAVSLCKCALDAVEKSSGAEHPDVAVLLADLALIYHRQGMYGEAGPLYKRALAISEKAAGSDHPDAARSLNRLAEFYRDCGDPNDLNSRSKILTTSAF